jgi:carboxylate-amine ligase
LRAATWRAARSGLEGGLVDPETRREASAAHVVRRLLAKVRPALADSGDWPAVETLAKQALADGGAARRMRRAAERDDLLACTDLLITETRGRGRLGSRPAGRLLGPVPGPSREVAGGASRAQPDGEPAHARAMGDPAALSPSPGRAGAAARARPAGDPPRSRSARTPGR